MKPEKKAADPATVLKTIGVREDLVPVLVKLGLPTVEAVKQSKPAKLFNDVCGMRKKMKLVDVANPTMEEVQSWFEEIK
jgi:lysyl-tRNA synthetase class 2